MTRKGLVVIILVLFLVGGAIVLSALPIVEGVVSGDLQWRVPGADEVAAEAVQEQRFDVQGRAKLNVENNHGAVSVAVSVTGGPGNQIVITAHKRVWAPNQTEAQSELDGLKVVATQDGATITVRVEQKPVVIGGSRADEVELAISVPTETAVTAFTSFGAVRLAGTRGQADLRTGIGGIEVKDVTGALKADSGNGAINIQRVQAEGGEVALTSRSGRIDYHSGRAESVNVETGSGQVTLSDLTVTGLLKLTSRIGSVTLKQALATSYDLDSQAGAISVDGATGRVKVRSGSGKVTITGGSQADLDLESNIGAISFAGSLGSGPHTVTSGSGRIHLTLPKDLGLNLDLRTISGQFKPNLPVTITSLPERSRWLGTINGGGANLVVSTRNGDIILDILNP